MEAPCVGGGMDKQKSLRAGEGAQAGLDRRKKKARRGRSPLPVKAVSAVAALVVEQVRLVDLFTDAAANFAAYRASKNASQHGAQQ